MQERPTKHENPADDVVSKFLVGVASVQERPKIEYTNIYQAEKGYEAPHLNILFTLQNL